MGGTKLLISLQTQGTGGGITLIDANKVDLMASCGIQFFQDLPNGALIVVADGGHLWPGPRHQDQLILPDAQALQIQ